jgi:hypothetical protein
VSKSDKGVKYHCRVREVSEDKLEKLYKDTNEQCRDCMYDCKNEIQVNMHCINKKDRLNVNELNRLLKEENVNLQKFCEDYNLKLYILIEMLRGNQDLKFKYYTCIMDRLHMVKDGIQMNNEYQILARKTGVGIQ